MDFGISAVRILVLGLMLCGPAAEAAVVVPDEPPPFGDPTGGADPPFTFTFSIGGNTGYGNLNTDPLTLGQYHATSGTLVVTAGVAAGTYSLLTAGPGQTSSPSGFFVVDNIVIPAADPTLDVYGLLFGASGFEVNIWGNGPGNYSFYRYNASDNNYDVADTSAGSFELTEVPIPPAALLLGSGLLSLFGFARRKSPDTETA